MIHPRGSEHRLAHLIQCVLRAAQSSAVGKLNGPCAQRESRELLRHIGRGAQGVEQNFR